MEEPIQTPSTVEIPEQEPKVNSKQRRRNATVERKMVNHIKSGTKGRKGMKHLNIDRVKVAFSRIDGMQALKFLHPRRLRLAVLNKTIPEGTFKPSE